MQLDFKNSFEFEWFLNMNFWAVTILPHLKWILSSRFGWFLNRWGNSFLRASSRSQVASASLCLLHCTRHIRTVKFLVCLMTVSKILICNSWYLRSSCKSTASTDTCSSRTTLKYFFSGIHGTLAVLTFLKRNKIEVFQQSWWSHRFWTPSPECSHSSRRSPPRSL